MPCGVPPGSCSPSCAAVSRCQVTPSRRGPGHRLVSGAGRLVAGRQEPARRVGDHVDRVTGLPRGDPAGSRQRPGLPVLAGPDGVVAERHPSARAARDPDGLVPQRGLAAAGQLDRGQPPGAPGVGRHEELLADGAVGFLRSPSSPSCSPRRRCARSSGRRRASAVLDRSAGCSARPGPPLPRPPSFALGPSFGVCPGQDGEDHGGRDGRGGQGRRAYRARSRLLNRPWLPAAAPETGRGPACRLAAGAGRDRGAASRST